MSPLLDLKDVSQTLEILRRTRRDLNEGPSRDAIDQQIVALTQHVTSIVGEDERLVRVRDAEQALLRTKPDSVNWDMLRFGGKLVMLVAHVLAGMEPTDVWTRFVTMKK